jgi:hypothetical protein
LVAGSWSIFSRTICEVRGAGSLASAEHFAIGSGIVRRRKGNDKSFSALADDFTDDAHSKEALSAVPAPVRRKERQQEPFKQAPLGWADILGPATADI